MRSNTTGDSSSGIISVYVSESSEPQEYSVVISVTNKSVLKK
ncbi:hypothetical protein DVK85_13125 [Flavobacterium arcticum]|uniref:Uncharacterized protein n=1 Tax=Flavobacterium arcticum TaxID=1784713 RepID=A0A345HEW1_9FLAO|nr:hypothetical protein DVK85_13125 [Flavobacterium arcticum]KAF2511099.1 hypothetical protein E0W72_06820 [Flavobacterium arcticum]